MMVYYPALSTVIVHIHQLDIRCSLTPSSSSMTIVSNDPTQWPSINSYRIASYFIVAASAGVIYDWALTLGHEVELIWRQHWSLMTGLYLSARYLGIIYAAIGLLIYVPTISLTDAGCHIVRYHDRSVACHVSAQKDADISLYHPPGRHYRQCSDHNNNND